MGSYERRKRKRLRSMEEYAESREGIKDVKEISQEMKESARLAELDLELQTDVRVQEKLKETVKSDMKKHGLEDLFAQGTKVSPEAKKALEQGNFRMAVAPHPVTHKDTLVALPEGKIAEKLPVKPSFSNQYVSQLLGADQENGSQAG